MVQRTCPVGEPARHQGSYCKGSMGHRQVCEAWLGGHIEQLDFFSSFLSKIFFLSPIPSKRRSEHVTCTSRY